MNLRMWYLIHKWTSLICTVFLLLLCLTGLPLIFRDELNLWLGKMVEPPEEVTLSTKVNLDTFVQEAKNRRPQDVVQVLSKDKEHPIWFVTMGTAAEADQGSALFMFDARDGKFLHDVPLREGILPILLDMHVELFAGLPGTLFLGAMGLIFLGSVVSGVVVYAPFMRKLPFGTVRFEGSPRLVWLDLHNLLGIVTVVWVLVVGATGVVNTLARPLSGLWQSTELAEMTRPWRHTMPPEAWGSLQQASEIARVAEPDLDIGIIAMPGTPFAGNHHYAFFMRGSTPLTSRLLKPVLVDAETMELSASRDLPWYLTFLLLSQPLHFGDYGGLPLKIIWAILDGISILILSSGLYLWWHKHDVRGEQHWLRWDEMNNNPNLNDVPNRLLP
jgi:uncharacterized iron-regulated membrane protein